MLNNSEEKPGIEEQYATAAETSNMRVGNDSNIRTPGDMIAAAGMNKHRMGLALRRLHSEWSAGAKPKPPTAEEIEAVAKSYKVETAVLRVRVPMTPEQIEAATADFGLKPEKLKAVNWLAALEVPNPHEGLVRQDGTEKGQVVASYLLPLVAAKAERHRWYAHELGLFLMGLKHLPWVRDAMLAKATREGWGCDEHVVGKVLLWWLDPKCKECGGAKERVVAGTGRTNGKQCRPCRGTGLQDPPHGWAGTKLAGYIRGCLAAAKSELAEGLRLDRTPAGNKRRDDEAASQDAARRDQVAAEEREEAERIARLAKE